MKDLHQGTAPSNYCPIICLSTTWKVQSDIIAAKIQVHINKYMSTSQKSIGNNTRGSKHQLLIDRAVTNDSRARQINLSTAWINYRTAYDSMLHTWIWECLALYTVNTTLRTFIKNSMGLWRTTLEVNSRLSSKECPLSFRCRCTAESCPEEVASLCCAIRLWMGCLVPPMYSLLHSSWPELF